MQDNRGFTLIEMLVVISIVGLLSMVVLSSIQSAKAKALNTKFAIELLELKKAVQMYRLDHDGAKPPCPPTYSATGNTSPTNCFDYFGFPWLDEALQPLITGGYISKIPHFDGAKSLTTGRWAYISYLPNAYNMYGIAALEYDCKPVDYLS